MMHQSEAGASSRGVRVAALTISVQGLVAAIALLSASWIAGTPVAPLSELERTVHEHSVAACNQSATSRGVALTDLGEGRVRTVASGETAKELSLTLELLAQGCPGHKLDTACIGPDCDGAASGANYSLVANFTPRATQEK